MGVPLKLNANGEPNEDDEKHDCHCQRRQIHPRSLLLLPSSTAAATDINYEVSNATDATAAPSSTAAFAHILARLLMHRGNYQYF